MLTFSRTTGNSFISGFTSTFEAFPFILNNKMTKFLILPLIVNIALLASIAWYSYTRVSPVLLGLVQFDQWYLKPVQYLVSPVLIILLLIAAFFVYSITGALIASPLLDIISLKTEKAIGGNVPDPGFSLKTLWRMAAGVLKLLILMLLLYIVILPLNLVPFAGSAIYAAAGFLLTSFFCGFQFYDMPLERRGFTFSEKFLTCRKFGATVTGTGAAFMLLSFIPVAGFLGIIVSTSGAAIAFRRVMEPAITRHG
ncbi:MAG TPA: EI24 domain-containing protein [Spirochaetota bacterium]|nr:EI24 domain-containing protein [Spirochaetota bacterium]